MRMLMIVLIVLVGCSQSVEVPSTCPAQDQTCPDGRCPLQPRETKEGFLKV